MDNICLQQQLIRELGSIIRNQIPGGRKSILTAYGEILCRAWKDSEGVCRLEIEDLVQVKHHNSHNKHYFSKRLALCLS